MTQDNYIDSYVSSKLRADNEARERVHSGRLSASMLGLPLQWSVLQAMNAPRAYLDDYTLRKFLRGNHCEDWVVSLIPDIIEKQKYVDYNGCVGVIDALVNTKDWDKELGIIPVEVKSVSNAKFKRIGASGKPDNSHLLQGALYALALGTEHFAILYIATDDYRIDLTTHKVADYKDEIDNTITEFNACMAKGEIPPFVPKEAWQANAKYQKYPLFADKSGAEARELLEKLIAKK